MLMEILIEIVGLAVGSLRKGESSGCMTYVEEKILWMRRSNKRPC